MTGPDERLDDVPATILCDTRCHLGEGPTYDAASDTAWWFDILERRLFETRLAARQTTIHELPVMVSALAVIDEGHHLLAADDGLYVRSLRDGRLSRYLPLEADNPATRSNDARVHPSGTFWIGTMGRGAERGAGAIYALHNGELTRLFADISIPNAICFAPDGATAYFADTRANVLCRVLLDPATGLPVAAPSELYVHGGTGDLDGAVVDNEGVIWNARWGGGCVDAYSPDGVRLRSVRVPAQLASCPAFVGADLSRLLVTSAWQGMDAAARAADPDHGRTFVLDVGVRGRAEPRVRLGPA
ncbi:SMP-30/gluconolactonase/LRE family protein [Bradyrhizobium sp. 2TAF24]|uniref:SMP-30/gluconolactonase/LRE family protein n=1 Tax=Bradyrhizobium sp. 2TAF24 TaxID=3233011 RepID=UPI003F8E5E57